MTTQEIREIAIESANTYYKYLEENDKGLQEVDVFELEYVNSKNIIKLRLAAKLMDTEGLPQSSTQNPTRFAGIFFNAD